MPNANLENQIEKNEIKIKELSLQMEQLERSTTDLFQELDFTPEQLSAYISRKENFSEELWQEMLEHRKLLDEKLEGRLSNVQNPLKAKRALADLRHGRNWIFVK